MADGETTAQSRRKLEYYFDASNGSVLAGKLAVREYIKSGGERESLQGLGELLGNPELPLPESNFKRFDASEWTRKDYLKYGRWLNRVVGVTVTGKSLNEPVLWRARKLGLGPSPRRIGAEFGSTSLYYKALGLTETHRISPFNDWLQEDYVRYIQHVGEEIESRPTYKELHARSLENTNNPSPTIIAKQFGGRKLGPVVELAGYPDIHSWELDDFVNWGVKFMLANDGLVPSARKINFFSTKGLGPSGRVIMDKFGKLSDYQQTVLIAYQDKIEEREQERKEKIEEINKALADNMVPAEIFDDTKNDNEKILRYARYVVLDHLLPDSFAANKISISTMSNPTVQKAGFVCSIKKANNAITPGDIESAALYLGVFDVLWPLDDYMERLKMPEEQIKPESLVNNMRVKEGALQKAA